MAQASPSADHAQSDDGEEERRGLGDLLAPPPTTAATNGSTSRPLTTSSSFMSASAWYEPAKQDIYKRVDVQTIYLSVKVHVTESGQDWRVRLATVPSCLLD